MESLFFLPIFLLSLLKYSPINHLIFIILEISNKSILKIEKQKNDKKTMEMM